jgi:hypothetical protein
VRDHGERGRVGTPPRIKVVSRRAAVAFLCAMVAAGCRPQEAKSAGTPPPNVALGRPASLVGGSGEPGVTTDGTLMPEGAPPAAGAVRLDGAASALVIDLGAVQPVGALLLQAGVADVYFVEASTDAAAWEVSWRVAPLHGVPELRTRRTVLPRPVPARWLRVRPTTSRSAAVSELQAFATGRPAWPRLDESLPSSQLPLWPALTRDRLTTLYAALGALLMLATLWNVLGRRYTASATEQRWRRGALVGLAAVSLLAWPNFLNFHYYGFVHVWEVFHYSMGGKYLPELGYTRLYDCAAAVDAEDGIDLAGRTMRDLRDNRVVPAQALSERLGECHAHFSPERWDDFRRDARFFRSAMGEEAWTAVRNDHGFNGTPVWAIAGGLLAGWAPASWLVITLLALLDVALLLAVFAMIGRSFGLEAACIAAAYFGVNTLAPFGWTGGGFLRYDWLFWLVAGIAALRSRRPALAGFALAYSSLLRVFPVCAIAGLVVKALAEAAGERSVRPLLRQARFAAAAAATATVFLGGSVLVAERTDIWSEFAHNSAKHLSTQTAYLIGLRVPLAYEHDGRLETMTDPLSLDRHAAWKARLSAAERDTWPAQGLAATAFLLLLALAVRGAPDWMAAVLGIGLMPMLFKLSSYYYGAFVGYAMLWPMSPGAGLALVSFAWLTNAISALWPNADQQSAWLSLAVVALVMGVTGALAWRRRAIDVGATPVGGQVEAEAEPRVTAATRGPSQDPLG